MPKPTALLDPPGSMEDVSLLNEVLLMKRQEVASAKSDLETLRAKLTSERVQWSQQKDEAEAQWRQRREELEDHYRTKMLQLDADIRHADVALANQRSLESAAEQMVVEAKARLDELDVLAKERLEVELLRKQAEDRVAEVDTKWSEGQVALSQAQDALKQSTRLAEDTQQRTLAMNQREADLKAREDAVALREKQVDTVNQELNRRLTAYAQEGVDVGVVGRGDQGGAAVGNGDQDAGVAGQPNRSQEAGVEGTPSPSGAAGADPAG